MMFALKNALYLGSPVNLLVENGRIVTMLPAAKELPKDCNEIFEANHLLLFPGFCDAHTHLREPGQEYKEDIDSGLTAAAYGGFVNVMCMANTKPVNDNPSVTRFMIEKAQRTHPKGPKLFPIGAATIDLAGEELAPYGELSDAGCIAISNDGKPIKSTEMLRRIMEYSSDFGLPFIDHCEDPWLAKGWVMHEGSVSGNIGVKGQPACGEAIQVSRDILLAEYLKIPIHIAHVSARMSVELIKAAKERGVAVTAETCPHYLLLDESCLCNYNSNYKMSPPLRSTEDRLALIDGVKTGVIDILATDHAPHAKHEKDTTLDNAPFGIIGLELAVSLTYGLVKEGVLTEADLIRLWLKKPAKIFGLPENNFNPGDPADFFLFDPQKSWRPNRDTLFSKSLNTPFLNRQLTGKVVHCWQKGIKLF